MIQRHYPETNTYVVYDPELVRGDPLELFSRRHDQQLSAPVGPSASVRFYQNDSGSYAWKSYRRRGFIARFMYDQYGWRRLPNTRMWKEFHAMAALWDLGLPVPRPVAARCHYRTKWSYAGDLLMLAIPDVRNLRDLLQDQELSHGQWARIGQTIARFHAQKVFHNDLNASNILLHPGGAIYWVDFDKCEFRQSAGSWQQLNLQRLKRSFDKLRFKYPGFRFTDANWQALLEGYQATGL